MPEIDAVLPLLPRDFQRFTLLARSLERFMTDLGQLWVVVPDRFHAQLTPLLEPYRRRLPLTVIKEQQWVPEMPQLRHLPGWYKQQLVKLAAAEFLSSDFFLTLDADVVCTRPVSYQQLVIDGRAPCHAIAGCDHPQWYEGSEAVLGLTAKRNNILHNVTPCVLARQGVLELIEHLNRVARERPYARGFRGIQQRIFFTLHRLGRHRARPPWRGWLGASRPWAEYATYFTFLEATGRYEQFHFDSERNACRGERSVWQKQFQIEPRESPPLFRSEGPPYFVVIQSNSGIDARRTWRVLEPWLGAAPEGIGLP